jgi:diguanylate cyclase (GGDEF)-like protein/PAS domain S-box-containing protein
MSLPPPVADDEHARLLRLHDLLVLDTDSEPLFDHLVQWAAEACGVPIALVSLVDQDRQWFKARTGLPDVSETPREVAFCAHAIASGVLFEVPDAHEDERFRFNPLVTGEPGIRFYAGAPLTLRSGERIGTLCVIDRQPRRLNPAQADTLTRLARTATNALQMRRDLLQRALTARSQHAQTLAESEARHRTLVDELSELISLARPDGSLVYANAAFARYVGLPREQLPGRCLHDFVAESERALLRDRIEWVLNTGQPLTSENRLSATGDDDTWVSWTHSVQVQPGGDQLVRSVGSDVSARRRAELALRSSQAFLERTGRVAGVGGWQLDIDSGQLTWSEQTRRIHEVPADFKPTLDSAVSFYAPAARRQVDEAMQHAIASGQGWDLELPLVTATGRPIWVRAVGEVEFADQQPVRVIGAFQDITARKALEERLAESERFMRQITDNLPVRIAYVDAERKHRFVNQAYCGRYGLPREEVIGRTRAELLGRADPPALTAHVAAALGGQAQRYEYEETVGGQHLHIESLLQPDFDGQGRLQGYFAISVDVTERSRNEQALRVLTTLIEQSSDFVLQSAPDGELLYMNRAARRVVGLADDAPLTGRRAMQFNAPETNRLIRREMLPAVQRDGAWRGETMVLAAGGQRVPVSHLVLAHRDERGQLLRYSSVLRDISSEVAARQATQRQTATLRSVTDALPVIVSAIDAALRFRFVNNAFEKWFGCDREQVLGHTLAELLAPDELKSILPWARRALAGETVQFERHYPERPGQPTLSLNYVPIRLEDGSTDGFVGVAMDITPHLQEQVRLQSLAERDPLTGLLNRAGLQSQLSRALQSGQGSTLALLYIDLDRFKPVNDQHGHAAGDALLQTLAGRLQRLVRPTDAIARLGGDEFAVLLHGVRDLHHAESVAAKVVDAASMPFDVGALSLQIGASVGVALGTHQGADGQDPGQALMHRADVQLYRAKQAGRDRFMSESSFGTLEPGGM